MKNNTINDTETIEKEEDVEEIQMTPALTTRRIS